MLDQLGYSFSQVIVNLDFINKLCKDVAVNLILISNLHFLLLSSSFWLLSLLFSQFLSFERAKDVEKQFIAEVIDNHL
jgi:hypothetical protein